MLSGFCSFKLRSRHCFIFKNLELLIYYMLAKSADPKLCATLLLPRSHLVILLTLCHKILVVIPQFIFFFILISYLLDIVLML